MRSFTLALFASAAAALPAFSATQDILIINGNASSSIAAPLTAAGFGVVQASFGPGVIAAALASDPNIDEVWVWNDGTFGNTFSPEVPALAFNSADEAALTAFNATHNQWIMDGLSWRANNDTDQVNFTENEGLGLAAAGGGIVLGADDASGAAIVQHVNEVASWFNFNLFSGVYETPSSTLVTGGSFFTTPNTVDPTQIFSTSTYSEVPNGLQPNGLVLGTAIFGDGTPLNGYTSYTVPTLPSEVFNGITYDNVNHLVTTTIESAVINPSVPDGGSALLLLAVAFGAMAAVAVRARARAL
jgi:hypothetical protein